MAARIAVLASGGGTNLQAIIDHFASIANPAGTIVLVASNREKSGALQRARAAGIATEVFDDTDDGTALFAYSTTCPPISLFSPVISNTFQRM